MNFITWLLVGGMLGWGASLLAGRHGRLETILNVAVGIAGVMLGGWLLSGLLESSPFSPGEFSLSGLLVSMLGAMVPLAAMQLARGITGAQWVRQRTDAIASRA
ncbi:MAG: GlsB/YeaQ/YmgE family stress response membrane protein [Pseudomonadota bacterium]|nr:GlsB/YeaQ/YmgE family stress response membrane protein [Pseudomonadota bacterium]